jgi:hypothetical protein
VKDALPEGDSPDPAPKTAPKTPGWRKTKPGASSDDGPQKPAPKAKKKKPAPDAP